jgi:hypothetical protein
VKIARHVPPRDAARRVATFWRSDVALSAFLAFLFITIFVVYPLVEVHAVGDAFIDVGLGALTVAGVVATWGDRRAALAAALIAVVDVGVRVVDWLSEPLDLHLLEVCLAMSTLTLLTAVVLAQTFREGEITVHRVQGAIAAYLLIGLVWALAYHVLVLLVPDAFHRVVEGPPGARTPWLVYFSFSTLTTCGYGDIAPVHPAARMLAMAEALTGQLFPAVLIARLVAMEIDARRSRRGG